VKLDPTTIRLFPTFPRDFALPKRKTCYSSQDLEKLITINNGIFDIYAMVYDHKHTIDKLYYDIDGKIKDVTKIAYKFLKFLLTEKDYSIITDVTGKKGFHFYIEIEPFFPTNLEKTKRELRLKSLTLIHECFGKIPTEFDLKVIGDINRITRVPNTSRPPLNINNCTYISHDDILKNDPLIVVKNIKRINHIIFPVGKLPKFDNLPIIEEIMSLVPQQTELIEGCLIETNNSTTILKNVLRPAVFRHITVSNPTENARIAATVDLLQYFSIDEIVGFYRNLGWIDWNEQKTREKIEYIKHYKPYSNSTLRMYGITD